MRDTLSDKDLTSFVIVLAAERLPVLESIELHQQLGRAGVNVGGLVVNKRSPEQQGEFLAARRAQENKHLETLDESLGVVPRQELALADQDVVGLSALEAFSAALAKARGFTPFCLVTNTQNSIGSSSLLPASTDKAQCFAVNRNRCLPACACCFSRRRWQGCPYQSRWQSAAAG